MTDRILVVDDDPQITSLLERYLAKQGFEVVCAASGQEMREILAKKKLDCAFLMSVCPMPMVFSSPRKSAAHPICLSSS